MNNRRGFTLIEMLVSMALIIFIMVIVTTAFTAGLATFRGMKAIGDMQQNLRITSQRLLADLREDHFEGHRRIGDPAFPLQGKVQSGFFRVVQATTLSTTAGAPYFSEGTDLDGVPGARAVDHMLHFTVKARGDRPQDFVTTAVPVGAPYAVTDPKPFDPASTFYKHTNYFNQPPDASFQQYGTYSTQWAEVAYYLVLSGWTDNPEEPAQNTGIPLFALYRVERLVVPRVDQLKGVVPASQYSQYSKFSCQPDDPDPTKAVWLVFNAPEDLASGQRSFVLPNPPAPVPGAALVLSNVGSFQGQLSYSGGAFLDLPVGAGGTPTPYDTAAQGNTPVRVSGLQITLRVWDSTTLQTRQVTIIQDM